MFNQIKKIHWFSSLSDLTVLSPLSVEFGFIGKQETTRLSHTLHSTNQIHSATILDLEKAQTEGPRDSRSPADGLYTEGEKTVCVRTADCLPVLLATKGASPTVMAVHAGWRGLAQGIVFEAIKILQSKAKLSDICVLFGPSISMGRYEVGPEVISAIQKGAQLDEKERALVVSKGKLDRWLLDISTVGALCALKSGILPEHISVLRSCTFEESSLWHSYRRDHELRGDNISWIRVAREKCL